MVSSSSSSSRQVEHQVFLSFRGPDTRHGFTSHLLKALKDKGINVFFDEETLEKGEELSLALLMAIAKSQIAIIILSEDYASSKSCLAELSEIMDCNCTKGQIVVVPIFYHVNPSTVKHHGGSFKNSFDEHQSKRPDDQVKRWKDAFAEVSKLKGWHIEGGIFDRSEPDYIKVIVEDVIKKLNSKSTSGSPEFVGINNQRGKILKLINEENTRVIGIWRMGGIGKTTLAEAVSEPDYIKDIVEDVIKKLTSKSTSGSEDFVENGQKGMILKLINEENTRVIGIWGIGGIGKTTLAEAVYNEVSPKFSDCCFLLNVREELENRGMKSLRNELLSKLLNQKIRIDTPLIGSTLIKERLRNKTVFVVLDDVNDSDQIECFGVKYFGEGSKILVTSRDRQVLMNGVDKIHKAKELNDDDSLQLFSRIAFKQLNPVADFRDLSNKFVDYAGGLPLALKVLGGALFGKPGEVWESLLDKLKEYPDGSILKVLQISFDGLDEVEKNIFLDIAFFFKGENKDDVTKLLSPCYEGAQFGISNLVDKCLVDLLPCDRFSMHDLLQDMGRDIVRQESINDPGKRSRICSPQDVYQVFKNNKGTESIQGIRLDISQIDALQLSPTTFEKMIHLRILKIYSSCHDEKHCKKFLLANHDPQSLPLADAPRFLRWDYYLWKFLSSKFTPKNQAVEFLPDELRCLWWNYYPSKSLPSKFNPKNLVELRLRHGEMEQLWNGDQDLVNLREIDLSHCKKLRKIPNLSRAIKLKVLNCFSCDSLVELPSLEHLISLENLYLDRCFKLKKFPEVPRHFIELDIQDTGIEEVPDSIEHLHQLCYLYMRNSRVKKVSTNISKLESLQRLTLLDCPFKELPSSIGCLNKLEILLLIRCESLVELPSLEHLTSLRRLVLFRCYKLKKFPEFPRHFSKLTLEDTEIEEVPDSIEHLLQLKVVRMTNSMVKKVSSNISKLEFLRDLDFSYCPIKELPIGCLNQLFFLNLRGTNIIELNFGETPTEEVLSSISRFKNLNIMSMSHCKSLKILSELPPSLKVFEAHDCTSLEKLSFTDQYISGFRPLDFLNFSNCFKLNQDSIDNIVENAMLRIGSIAKQIADEYLRGEIHVIGGSRKVFCCLPGNEILEKFEHQSMNSSIILKISPNRCSGKRFLVFTLCFVVDIKHPPSYKRYPFKFICEGRLKAKGGEIYSFKHEFIFHNPVDGESYFEELVDGEHVCVLFNADMVYYDIDYEEASFEFYFIIDFHYFDEDEGGENFAESSETIIDDIKVEKCGVNVSYVEYNDVEKVHDDYTIKMRPGHKRKFSNDGEGERGSKRLK